LVQTLGLSVSRDDFCFRTDSDLAQLAALRAGVGIGGCQVGIARQDPALMRVLPGPMDFTLEMWLLTHASLRTNVRVMTLFRYLNQALTDYAQRCQ
jgi:DNA-binding transcriptional LysR family regulator